MLGQILFELLLEDNNLNISRVFRVNKRFNDLV